MHPNKKRAPAAAIVTTLITALFSNTPFAADTELAQVVVTATRQPTRSNELLSDVSVISREEVEQAGQSTLSELLGRQPGIEFSSNGGPGSAQSLFIRGTNAEHAVVLVDGIRLSSATLGSTSLSRIPLSQIDRIEILRGPASSLYGADAIGGVIQIFTRQGDGPAKFSGELAYGTYNTTRAVAGVGGSHEGLSYSFQYAQDNTDGFSNVGDPKSKAYNKDHDRFRNTSYTANLGYRFNADHEIGITAFSSDGTNRYDGGFSASSASKDYKSDLRVASTSLTLRDRFLPGWQSTLRIGQGVDDTEYLTNGVRSSAVRTDTNQFQWQNDITLPLGKLLAAIEQLTQKVDATQSYTSTERTIKSLLGGWTASAGANRWQINVRRDDISNTDAKTTGTLGYGYQFTDTLRASVSAGTAYKAPSINDLYYPNTAFVGRGNPNLKPESARNAEAALHWETATQQASATYYDNRIKDLIQWSESPPGSFFYVPQNVSDAHIKGLTLAYTRNFGALTLRGNADFLEARDEGTGNLLPRRARTHGLVGADYAQGAWSLGGEIFATGRRYNDTANTQLMGGYTLLNLVGNYRIDKEVSLFVRANNVFDKHYEQVQYYQTPGANMLAGIRYQPR
jgi:vitamin B12 transporter